MENKKVIPNAVSKVTIHYEPAVKTSEMHTVSSAEEIADLVRGYWEDLEYRESFYVLLLNKANKVLGLNKTFAGGIDLMSVDIKVILQLALTSNAASIVIMHNHPSGSLTRSQQDDAITKRIKNACALCEVKLLDHIILTGESHVSYASEGEL